ncbi:MAG: efflux RND transporter periplasmic adaptor subunit [Pseudomonadota bacterium]
MDAPTPPSSQNGVDHHNHKTSPKPSIGLRVRRFATFGLPVIAIVGFVGVNAGINMIAPKPEKKEEVIKATPVVATEAIAKPVTLSIRTQGAAQPRVQINLASNVSGRIDYVSPAFIEGGIFTAGEVLVSVEDEEFRYRVTEAKANVAQAENRFASEAAEANAARLEFDELSTNSPLGAASDLTLRKPQMAEAAAMLSAARANLKNAELQLARTKVRAPFDGRVTQKTVDVGEFIAPGTALGRIFGTSVMEVRLPLTDRELAQLALPVGYQERAESPGPAVDLHAVVAGRVCHWQGRIVRTDSQYDPQTRVLFAYVAVDDPYGTGADAGMPLAAGLFVNADIQGKDLGNAVIIPRAALRGEAQVFVARNDNTLEIRTVTIAQSGPDGAVITGGVTPGERVITSPVKAPATGMAIAIAGDRPNDDGGEGEEASSVALSDSTAS